MPFLLGLFGSLPSLIQWGIIAGIVATIGGYVYEYDARGRELAALTLQYSAAQDKIVVETANVTLAKNAIEILGKAYDTRAKDIETECKLLTSIATSKEPGADDPVHKLIADTLKQLGPR